MKCGETGLRGENGDPGRRGEKGVVGVLRGEAWYNPGLCFEGEVRPTTIGAAGTLNAEYWK